MDEAAPTLAGSGNVHGALRYGLAIRRDSPVVADSTGLPPKLAPGIDGLRKARFDGHARIEMRPGAPPAVVICGIVTLICTVALLTGLNWIGADTMCEKGKIA